LFSWFVLGLLFFVAPEFSYSIPPRFSPLFRRLFPASRADATMLATVDSWACVALEAHHGGQLTRLA
jgi:hypothetical protein